MEQQIETRNDQPEVSTLMVLNQAVKQGASIETIERLLALHERWEANEARKAYNEAIAQFKRNPPRLTKNKHVEFGNTKYDHATLDAVTEAITQSLSNVGISHRWEVQQSGAEISVTCVLTHVKGHSERTTLKSGPDTSGQKNPIQAIASATTYLQRYTLLMATGTAAGLADDDAASSSMSGEQIEQIEYLKNASTMDELQKLFKQYYKQAAAAKNQTAMQALITAKEERKAEL